MHVLYIVETGDDGASDVRDPSPPTTADFPSIEAHTLATIDHQPESMRVQYQASASCLPSTYYRQRSTIGNNFPQTRGPGVRIMKVRGT